jgi:hypothetical protein
MPNSKQLHAAPVTFAELSACFDQFERDTPGNDFPTFLETLLFDHAATACHEGTGCERRPTARPPARTLKH